MKRQRKYLPLLLSNGVGVIIDPLWKEYPEFRGIYNRYKKNDKSLNKGVITTWDDLGPIRIYDIPCELEGCHYKETAQSELLGFIKIKPDKDTLKAYQCQYPLKVYPPGKTPNEVLPVTKVDFIIHNEFVLWRPYDEWYLYHRGSRKFQVFLHEREPYLRGYIQCFESIKTLHNKSPKESLDSFKSMTPEERIDYYESGPLWENTKFNPEVKPWM
jgi:hypothetical protein